MSYQGVHRARNGSHSRDTGDDYPDREGEADGPWPGRRALTDGLSHEEREPATPTAARKRPDDSKVEPRARPDDGIAALIDAAMATPAAPATGHARDRVEHATGHSLAGARIHTGEASAAAAAALGAPAFTIGQDIHFGAERHQPGTVAGDRLIAHELVHTLQQGGTATARPQPGPGTPAAGRNLPAEEEARAVAAAALAARTRAGSRPVQAAALPIAFGDPPDEPAEGEQTEEPAQELSGQETAGKLGEPVWEYEAASDPVKVLEQESKGALARHEDARKAVADARVLLEQVRKLKQKHDPRHQKVPPQVLTEYAEQISALERGIATAMGQVPSTEKRKQLNDTLLDDTYEHVDGHMTDEARTLWSQRKAAFDAEDRAVKDQIAAVDKMLGNVESSVTEARNGLRGPVQTLSRAESTQAEEEGQLAAETYGPLLPADQVGAFGDAVGRYGDATERLAGTASKGDVTGQELADNMAALEASRAEEAVALAISRTVAKIDQFAKVDMPRRLGEVRDECWDANASSVIFTKAYGEYEARVEQELGLLQELRGVHIRRTDPAQTDTAAFDAAVDAKITQIRSYVDSEAQKWAPLAEAASAVERLVDTCTQLEAEHAGAVAAALPDLKAAVVAKQVVNAITAELHKAQAAKASIDGGTAPASADFYRAELERVRAIPEQVAAEAAPRWFTFSADILALGGNVEEAVRAGQLSEEAGDAAKGQINLAALLSKYDSLSAKIAAARQAIERDGDPDKKDAALGRLAAFESRVLQDMKAEVGAAVDGSQLEGARAQIASINSDVVQLMVSGPSVDDDGDNAGRWAVKLANEKLWDNLRSSDKGWKQKLGALAGGLDKASTGLDLIIGASKVLESANSVSMVEGATHPAIEGLGAALDGINTFNKIPIFKEIVGGYIVALQSCSVKMAKIEQYMQMAALDIATVTGDY